jgi:hypothetical protein
MILQDCIYIRRLLPGRHLGKSNPKERMLSNKLELIATGKLTHVKVTGKLTKEAYEQLTPVVDQQIQEHG